MIIETLLQPNQLTALVLGIVFVILGSILDAWRKRLHLMPISFITVSLVALGFVGLITLLAWYLPAQDSFSILDYPLPAFLSTTPSGQRLQLDWISLLVNWLFYTGLFYFVWVVIRLIYRGEAPAPEPTTPVAYVQPAEQTPDTIPPVPQDTDQPNDAT